jgi:hypothetical protein
MNERIKELLKMSTKSVGPENCVWDPENRVWVFSKVDQEKFAELIVKETMQVVANNFPQNTYLDIADAVIEHFKE